MIRHNTLRKEDDVPAAKCFGKGGSSLVPDGVTIVTIISIIGVVIVNSGVIIIIIISDEK